MPEWNRRVFLGAATSALAASAQAAKLRLGVIGCGWYGGVDMAAAYKAGGVEVVALCDVDSQHLNETAAAAEKAQGSRPRTLTDYRELLALNNLDGVIIATPPHWHALPFIEACQKGLPVYCEKPVAYDVREGQAMAAAAKKAGNMVQLGFQRRQSDAFRGVRDYVKSGAPGRIVQADVQIHYTAATPDPTPQAPPPTLDWELWLGPAPKMAYSPAVGHKSWRLEQNIGNGHLVDWGIHLIDATRFMLGLGIPTRVTATGGLYEYTGKITTPDTLTASFEFEQLPVVWRHRLWGAAEYTPEVSNGVFLYGEKETIFVTDNRWVVIPREKGAQRRETVSQPAPDLGGRHVAEWLTAVRAKQQPSCSIDDAWQSTTTVQLAMISYKVGRPVQFDAKSVQIAGDSAANQLLKRPYRAPYKHPYA